MVSNKLFSNGFFDYMTLPVGKIFQIEELSLLRGSVMPEHKQHCDEITYVVSGRATMWSDTESVSVGGGQIHYIKKGVNHKIEVSDDENFRYICIGFIPNENCGDISEFVDKVRSVPWTVANDDGNIRILSEMLINEIFITDSMSEKMINLYISQILISMYRVLCGGIRAGNGGGITNNFTIYHILRYIDREYLNIKSVKSISEKLSYSEYYISHLFKEKMGMSVKEYITKKKITAAAGLIKSSNQSIREIAERLSFSSAHTFSQAFKRYYSVSPNDYRRAELKSQGETYEQQV